ncbi:MAG: D-aminoacylase [Limnochordia bacterium]|nr:D-aminoacylase [Limnochordia bacterium]
MFDYAIKNGTLVDGSRQQPTTANLYLKDGRIAEISTDDKPAHHTLDASGRVVSPGFVDIHSHSDVSYVTVPTHQGKLVGGVTFELVGQCGISAIPLNESNHAQTLQYLTNNFSTEVTPETFSATDFASYASHVEQSGVSVNMGGLIGHGTLRGCIAGWEMRQLSPSETETMCALLEQQLEQGALGLSLGLIYPPGSFCNTGEIVALAEVLAKHDRMLAVHLRNENKGVFDAMDEMITVAKKTGVKLQISHLKLMGTQQWGRADELLAKVDLARAQGVRIHCDQYPYCATSSGLTSCLPKWAMEGGLAQLVQRLNDPETFAKIVANDLPEMQNRGGAKRIVISDTHGAFTEVEGMTLQEAADSMDVTVPNFVRQVLLRCGGSVRCIYHSMDRDDMLKIMARRDVATGSDGTAFSLDNMPGKLHPRNTSSFPCFLRTVREEGLMPLEDAVYKITALPATLMGLGDKIGLLREGYAADITVFDYNTIADTATYQQANTAPLGIDYVFVNGELVLDHGKTTDARPGQFYR